MYLVFVGLMWFCLATAFGVCEFRGIFVCGDIHCLSILIPSHVILIDCGTSTSCQLVASTMQTLCVPWGTSFQRTFWLALRGEGKGSGVEVCPPSNCHFATLATTTGAEEGERGLGKYVVYRNVWHHGICFGYAVLQTWHEVCYKIIIISKPFIHEQFLG